MTRIDFMGFKHSISCDEMGADKWATLTYNDLISKAGAGLMQLEKKEQKLNLIKDI